VERESGVMVRGRSSFAWVLLFFLLSVAKPLPAQQLRPTDLNLQVKSILLKISLDQKHSILGTKLRTLKEILFLPVGRPAMFSREPFSVGSVQQLRLSELIVSFAHQCYSRLITGWHARRLLNAGESEFTLDFTQAERLIYVRLVEY